MTAESGGESSDTAPTVNNPFAAPATPASTARSSFAGLTPTTNSPSLGRREVHKIDELGDLFLEVGTESPPSPRIRVCSRTLARSSPVFKKMLYGRFAEARRNSSQDWVVSLPDDDYGPFVILLNIVHGRHFSHLAQLASWQPDFVPKLFGICVLTDKYDMADVLRPWATTWVTYLTSASSPNPYHQLWITWELGLQASFKQLCVNLVLGAETAVDGTLRLPLKAPGLDGTVLDDPNSYTHMPPLDIIEPIRKIRYDTINSILKTFATTLDALLDTSTTNCKCYAHSHSGRNAGGFSSQEECDVWSVGALTVTLRKADMYPIPTAADFHESLATLRMKFDSVLASAPLKVHPIREYRHKQPCNHIGAIKVEVNKIFDSIPSIVTDFHLNHMKLQSGKTGVYEL